MKIIAECISYALNPVALSIFGTYYIVYRTTLSVETAFIWACTTAFFASVVTGFILYGLRKGFFSNIDVSKRRERYLLYPVLLTVMSIYAAIAVFFEAPAPLTIAVIFLIPTVAIFEFINTKIKGSIHMATITGATLGFAYYYGGDLYWLLLLIPLVAWARIIGKKHSKEEVIVGTMYGAVFAIIGVNIVQFFR